MRSTQDIRTAAPTTVHVQRFAVAYEYPVYFTERLFDPANPLPARVMANRIWQYHFGRGIVRTSSDFGFQGSPPTHPELLDWLATEFVRQGWRLKPLHRTIMLSATYQMSSQFDPAAFAVDPANDLLWRFDMRRLSAEELRDSILAVSGSLNSGFMENAPHASRLPNRD